MSYLFGLLFIFNLGHIDYRLREEASRQLNHGYYLPILYYIRNVSDPEIQVRVEYIIRPRLNRIEKYLLNHYFSYYLDTIFPYGNYDIINILIHDPLKAEIYVNRLRFYHIWTLQGRPGYTWEPILENDILLYQKHKVLYGIKKTNRPRN